MKRFVLFVTLSLVLMLAVSAFAGIDSSRKNVVRGNVGTVHGAAINSGKALGDTTYMIGNPRDPDQVNDLGVGPQANGTFQDQFGNPGWFGWTSQDITYSPDSFWNVSDFNVISGNWSMWCGDCFANGDCGYGNNWNQNLVYTYTVPDPNVNNNVQLIATFRTDSEPDYDYTYVEFNKAGVWNNFGATVGYDGLQLVNFNESVLYRSADYTGSNGDQVQLRFRFQSDGGWSDEDGDYTGDGAVQVDDIQVFVGGNLVEEEDFEDGPGGTYNWLPVLNPGVGNYAALYLNLLDEDICRSNTSPQVAFVDDGVVVPGTGGSPCTTWCYGPGGWIVNNTGGLEGPDYYIHNFIISPVVEWPAGADAGYIQFEVYRHEAFENPNTDPGMFYERFVRSVDTGDPADIESATWTNDNFVQYGGPDYLNQQDIATPWLIPGRTHVQMALTVYELGYVWGFVGTDGTPAPYFDNAKFVAYPFQGPAVTTRTIDVFQDNFPAIGDIDYNNLANNAVRLDMANNVASNDDMVNYPGDSITFDVTPVRSGSALNDFPKLYVRMKANPLFDGVRVLPPNFTQTGNIVEGWVYGDSTFNDVNGNPIFDRYNFDLPDDDFFFPGDRMNFYCEAQDNLGGDIGTSLIPADTSGFWNVDANLQYPPEWTVRALPTMFSATPGDQPSVLLWEDAIDRGGLNEWFFALGQIGYIEGVDYDMFVTNGPSSGVGNGIGGRATSAQLSGYSTMLYTSSYLSTNLLSNGDFQNDASDDLNVVTNWFGQGGKNAFMTGDDLVTALGNSGSQGTAFINSYFNVNYVGKSIQTLIGDQTAPLVRKVDGNPVIARVDEWIAYGGCLLINTFDAIEPLSGTVNLAEFTDPDGTPGVYPYTAGSFYYNSTDDARVVLMPYDFMYLYNAPGWTPPVGVAPGVSARAVILQDVLDFFGEPSVPSTPIGTPDTPKVMTVSDAFPNPFNPKTSIKLNLPVRGQVSLKVYNVRGELIRTLVNGVMDQGVHTIEWDGKSDRGSQVASGVYFYETKANGQVQVKKMALVK